MKQSTVDPVAALALVALLSACGGSGKASTTPSEPASTTPSAAHTAEPGEPTLIQLAGYVYQDPTDASLLAAVPDSIETANSVIPDTYTAGSVHYVTNDAGGRILLIAMRLGTKMDAMLGESVATATGVVTTLAGSGATMRTSTISTQPVASAAYSEDGTDRMAFAWVHNGVVTSVVGWTRTGRRVCPASLAAAHSQPRTLRAKCRSRSLVGTRGGWGGIDCPPHSDSVALRRQ